MSRSHKYHPVVTGAKHKSAKRQANKKVRHLADLGNFSFFKKCYLPYNICDYKIFKSKHQFLKEYLSAKFNKHYKSINIFDIFSPDNYYKYYYRK